MSDKPEVQEPKDCPKCNGIIWVMGYDKTGEFINKCAGCGYVFLP